MFSTCSFVCPSVRLFVDFFVRLLPTCERYTSKTSEPISMQIGINLPLPGQGRGRSSSGVRRSKVKVTGGRTYVWKPGGDIIFDPVSWVDRSMQWVTEMLPLKNIVLTAPHAFVVYASCWRTCFLLYTNLVSRIVNAEHDIPYITTSANTVKSVSVCIGFNSVRPGHLFVIYRLLTIKITESLKL